MGPSDTLNVKLGHSDLLDLIHEFLRLSHSATCTLYSKGRNTILWEQTP